MTVPGARAAQVGGDAQHRSTRHEVRGLRTVAARPVGWLLLASLVAPISALALATLLGLHPVRGLSDPTAYTQQPFYIGIFSNTGVLGWWTAAVASALAGSLLRRRGEAGGALLAAGAISAVLGLDDLLLLHEQALPAILGVPQELPVAMYGIATLFYLWRFRALHLAVAPALLAAALGMFGLSVLIDVTRPAMLQGTEGLNMLFEDGAKFTGVCCWTSYHLVLAHHALRAALR